MTMRDRITNQLGSLLLANMEAQQTVEDLHEAVKLRDAEIVVLKATPAVEAPVAKVRASVRPRTK